MNVKELVRGGSKCRRHIAGSPYIYVAMSIVKVIEGVKVYRKDSRSRSRLPIARKQWRN